jgi:hypothetical protein
MVSFEICEDLDELEDLVDRARFLPMTSADLENVYAQLQNAEEVLCKTVIECANQHNPDFFRVLCTLQVLIQKPASSAANSLLTLDRVSALRWFYRDGRNLLRANLQVDTLGLGVYVLYLQASEEVSPGFKFAASDLGFSFDAYIKDELAALEGFGASDTFRSEVPQDISFPLPFLCQEEEVWCPQHAVDQWGFVITTMIPTALGKSADALRNSCRLFGLPYSLHRIPNLHCSTSPLGSSNIGRFGVGVGGALARASAGATRSPTGACSICSDNHSNSTADSCTKPNFLHSMLARHGRPVLYVDFDAVVLAPPLAIRGTQFTCFTGTTVQILTLCKLQRLRNGPPTLPFPILAVKIWCAAPLPSCAAPHPQV